MHLLLACLPECSCLLLLPACLPACCYCPQVVVPLDKGKTAAREANLVEVGPRFCLQPIKVFAGSFGGATLYENPAYVSPNALRSLLKQRAAGKYGSKVNAKAKRRAHEAANPAPRGRLDDVFK